MNLLFLTITPIEDFSSPSVHIGILKKFRDAGDNVYIVSPYERKTGKKTELVEVDGVRILHVRIGNITKCGLIEKGLTTISIDKSYIRAINHYFGSIVFDMILYSTPPITLYGVIKRIKKKNNALSYLMLKDIFPQNAVDIGLMSTRGFRGIMYRYFRHKEKQLYRISDYIGCMSPANVEYLLRHNDYVNKNSVEICPNSIEISDKSIDEETRCSIRIKYGIPLDKTVFIYGGNLGKPQGVPFIVECLNKTQYMTEAVFLIVGDGTDYHLLEDYISDKEATNVVLVKRLSKEDYDTLVAACDIGLIFLDHRFTIPNFPSRLLSYMQAKIPVFAVTDPNTDVGKTIVEGGFGWWCESNDSNQFVKEIEKILVSCLEPMKEKEFNYLQDHYSANEAYETIRSHIN